MDRKPFQFKQFTIFQDKTAMKIGTDGVLLGAFISEKNPKKIVDIGTGTGLIALMMAQKYARAKIDAIEIELEAYVQAKENFSNSKWSNRFNIFHQDFKNFKPNYVYDLVVSNPPFYNSTFKKLEQKRATARHTQGLSFFDLLEKTASLLSPNGSFYVIIPFYEEADFVVLAKSFGLFPEKILHVKGNNESEIKRSVLKFTFQEKTIEVTLLTIENSRKNYTQDYIDLTKDFYLKM